MLPGHPENLARVLEPGGESLDHSQDDSPDRLLRRPGARRLRGPNNVGQRERPQARAEARGSDGVKPSAVAWTTSQVGFPPRNFLRRKVGGAGPRVHERRDGLDAKLCLAISFPCELDERKCKLKIPFRPDGEGNPFRPPLSKSNP